MIIKSHIRGGYRAAADYLKDIGKNEVTRLVSISDHDAKNLDEAFQNMWAIACNTKCQKPLHHISINPFWDEKLTDEQVFKIVERAEQKYGYKPGNHQRVIVEHIKDGRQHFHVMWCRVSLKTGKAVWPGEHWKKSKQVAREMEKELGLKRPTPKRFKKMFSKNVYAGSYGSFGQRKKYGARNRYGGSKRGKSFTGSSYSRPTRSSWRMSNIGQPAVWQTQPSKLPPSILTTGTKSKPSTNAVNAQSFARRYSKGIGTKSNRTFTLSRFKGGASRSWHLPYGNDKQDQQPTSLPMRPAAHGGMSKAQLADLLAAIEGKISWAEYFRKWGGGDLTP